jgi:hypothetical protein
LEIVGARDVNSPTRPSPPKALFSPEAQTWRQTHIHARIQRHVHIYSWVYIIIIIIITIIIINTIIIIIIISSIATIIIIMII